MADFYYVKRKGTDKKMLVNLDKVILFFEDDENTVRIVLDDKNSAGYPGSIPIEGTLFTVARILGDKAQ